jgi:predicted transglutaminase-like cysteine proteinase
VKGIKFKGAIFFVVCFFIAYFFFSNTNSVDSPNTNSPAPAVNVESSAVNPSPMYTSLASPGPTSSALNIVAPTPAFEQLSQIQASPAQDKIINKIYSWNYDLSQWTLELNINQASYDYYKALPRPETRNYSVYVTHPSDDEYINNLAEKIREAGQEKGYSELDIISLAAAFVQSLDYTYDNETTGFDEYPRYPIETLVDGGGDCEDTAILTASLIHTMGYGVVLLRISDLFDNTGHMAVGVNIGDSIAGSYYDYQSEKYYYLETTGEGWKIGQLPDEYKEKPAKIFSMVPVAVLTHSWETQVQGSYFELKVTVENLGSAAAENVYIYAGFEAEDNKCWNTECSQSFTLGIGSRGVSTLYLTPPYNKHTRLLIQIVYQGYAVDESHSKWFDT